MHGNSANMISTTSPTSRSARLLLAAGALALGWNGAVAAAQVKLQIGPRGGVAEVVEAVEHIDDPALLKRTFDRLVTDISGNDYAARQQASEKLYANDQFDLPLLETALKREGLSLEARTRLLAIARQRFYRTPRAALGFQFGGLLRDRIVVGQTFPKFAAFGILEEGDMICVADGFKLEGPGAKPLLQSIIISHEPGEVLKLVIRRGPRKMELNVTLGKFADLDQGGGALLEDRLARAWRIRSQAKIGAPAEPIRVEGARPAPWGASEEVAQRKVERLMQRDANEYAPKLAGGGMPRLLSNPDEARYFEPAVRQQLMVVGGQVRFANMPFVRGGFFGDVDPDMGLPAVDLKVERAQLLEARIASDRRMGGTDPTTLTPDDPRRQDLLEMKKARDLINKQLEALDAEADEIRSASKDGGKHSAADANPTGTP
jgi:hypothetical protein